MRHVIVFTGHLIDDDRREKPRFPANKEAAVRGAISKQIKAEIALTTKTLVGIAGGACGGDILFHELCEELGISTEMYLAMPVQEFKKRSVSYAGKSWDARFDRLIKKVPVHILPKEKMGHTTDNVWALTNQWMLNRAFEVDGKNMTLIALWDGKEADGEGGTNHMITIAKEIGAKISIIEINKIHV